ncbi:glycosyltransferase family A protein [Luteimonas sp. 100069]|uniref:glycosyltransferase family 2 protein n=1 Tax=Luteimonas sp. 100069 TaxID=2006109 RepID=UPI000F4EFC7F|nr:glycosyltransferase family A protein [Luteimonas sp. 100069]RPD87780.1 glycosyltransferase family 2 protein [Luteimonas sp. 100069]
MDHSFVIPAYGCSPHLVECLESLKSQTAQGSEIVLCTSTPSDDLSRLAERFSVSLRVHGPNGGIGRDWNAALDCASRGWVTIAHQDDVYLPDFVKLTMAAVERTPKASLVMTGYSEMLEGRVRERSKMLRIKSVLLELGFLGRHAVAAQSSKTRLLRFGCPVACPSVTLGPPLSKLRFREDLRVDLDWEAWIRAALLPGAFCYVRERLMLHRIHGASETTAGVRDGARAREDAEMFGTLWPAPVARLLARAYALSYEEGGHA